MLTSRARMALAMRPRDGRPPDRAPVMCQLALGHYFLHAPGGPIAIWHDGETFARALIALQQRYGFDGILVNLPGRPPAWRDRVRAIERKGRNDVLRWTSGRVTLVPPDDNPYSVDAATGKPVALRLAHVDVERLYYIESHDLEGITPLEAFPPWHWDTLRTVRSRAPEISVHAEVYSPLSQLMELVGPMEAGLALALDPGRVRAALERLTRGTIDLARGHARAGADAILISSAFAGAGFLSPAHYEAFVLPFEAAVIAAVKATDPDLPVYTHTCGAIGDRLELMERTGTDGIDTLDPPPLGTVDLEDAIRRLGKRVFLKGNIDPVNTVLRGTPEQCAADARRRLAVAAPGGGYILSTACSVPPHAPPDNIRAIARAALDAGGSR